MTRCISVLLLCIGIMAAGCRQRTLTSSSLSTSEKTALNANLAKLDETLAAKSPFVFEKLSAGANSEELKVLRSELGGAQIECLELWYQWHNGSQDQTILLLPLGRMLSIAEAIDDHKLIQGVAFVDSKRKSAWKILDDGAGDGFFLDIANTNPRVFYHMLEDPYPRDYGTLDEFVAFVADVHNAGLASRDPNGIVKFDLDRYQQLEAEYLARLGKTDQ